MNRRKRASKSGQSGSAGQTAVKYQFEKMGWGPIPAGEHDDGTDFYVQIRDADLNVLGLVLGVQVKTEKAYSRLSAKARSTSDQSLGWYYRPKHPDDVGYWLTHSVPHALVLNDADSGLSYWTHVNAETVTWTQRGGAKVWVPLANTLDAIHRDELHAVAAAARMSAGWAGSSWASLDSIPRDQRLRYALVAPRLVATHMNRRLAGPPAPEDALAQTMLGHFDEAARLSEKSEVTQQESKDPSRVAWWMYSSLRAFLAEGASGLEGLDQSLASGSSPAAVAVAALLAGLHAEVGSFEQVNAILSRVDVAAVEDAVDRAWIDMHKARYAFEVDDLQLARDLALDVVAVGRLNAHDPTAVTLRAAALRLLYFADPGDDFNAVQMIQANDSPPSWWAAQQLSWGLSDYFDVEFRMWSGEGTSHAAGGEDWDRLRALVLQAGVVGDQQSWCTAMSNLARLEILQVADGKPHQVAGALNDLRLAGAETELKKACAKVAADYSAEALRIAGTGVNAGAATRTSDNATIVMLGAAADLMDDDSVRRNAEVLVSRIWQLDQDPPTRRNADSLQRLLEALTRMVTRLSGDELAGLKDFLLTRDLTFHQPVTAAALHLVRQMEDEDWTEDELPRIRELVGRLATEPDLQVGDATGWVMHWRALLAKRGGELERAALLDEAKAGNDDALWATRGFAPPDSTLDPLIIDRLAARILADIQEAKAGQGVSLRGQKEVYDLIRVNSVCPGSAQWTPVVEVLKAPPTVLHLSDALVGLYKFYRDVPPDVINVVLHLLQSHAGDDRTTRSAFLGVDPPSDARRAMYALVSPLNEPAELLQRLSCGRDGRSSVARAIGDLGTGSDIPLLCSLASDSDPIVRASVAEACVRWKLRAVAPVALDGLLDHLTDSPGNRNALAVVRAIPLHSDVGGLSELLDKLQTHRSAAVRRRAGHLLAGSR